MKKNIKVEIEYNKDPKASERLNKLFEILLSEYTPEAPESTAETPLEEKVDIYSS